MEVSDRSDERTIPPEPKPPISKTKEEEAALPTLSALLEQCPDAASIKGLQGKAREIAGRYEQLTSLSEKEHGLTHDQKLRLAYFIAIELPPLAEKGTVYFKKTLYELPRSLAYEPTTKEVFVLTKRNVELLDVFGGAKRVNSAILLPLQEASKTAELVAQSSPTYDTKFFISMDMGNPLKRDAELHLLFNGLPGIWKLHTVFHYIHEKMQIETLSIITALAEGDLTKLPKPLPLSRLQPLTKALIQAVATLHQRGYIHGDLRLKNALFRGDTFGLIDFGNTFKPGKEKDPALIMEEGIYGLPLYTAPELYSKENFSGDFFKLDIWALGSMLYQLHFGTEPPWGTLLERKADRDDTLPQKLTSFHESVQKTIEEPLARLQTKETLTPDEHFDTLLYQMLRLDPQNRSMVSTATIAH